MKTLFVVIFIIGLAVFLFGFRVQSTAQSADEAIGAAVPWILGAVIIALDLLFAVIHSL